MTENKDMYAVFYEEIENEQKKDKKNLTYRSRDSNPRFSVIFLAMIWIFMVGEGDEIKSKQASKWDRTLQTPFQHGKTTISTMPVLIIISKAKLEIFALYNQD